MELDGGKTNVQLIYQSPILTDFQSVVSNRTSNVSIPLTPHNLKAIGYVGEQVGAEFPYRKHSVIYKRDGIQLLEGFATLLNITGKNLSFCFTWGNVKAMQLLFDTSLRDLALSGETYVRYPPNRLGNDSDYYSPLAFGAGRNGVRLNMTKLLSRIESVCGVSNLLPLAYAVGNAIQGHEYFLSLPTRNGDAHTKELQALHMGTPVGYSLVGIGLTLLKGADAEDFNEIMNEESVIDVTGNSWVRIRMKGRFQYYGSQADADRRLVLMGLSEYGWEIFAELGGPTGYNPTKYDVDIDRTLNIDIYSGLILRCVRAPIGTVSNFSAVFDYFDIIRDPGQGEDVLYGTGKHAYPVYHNLPDMSCGQLIKNLLWLKGAFAYTIDGKTFQYISFNQLRDNKAIAVDWTEKMRTLRPTERSTKIDGTAKHNWFNYAEASYYDCSQYRDKIQTDDDTLDEDAEYCTSDFAIAPSNAIPVWSSNENGEFEFAGGDLPCVLSVFPPRGAGGYSILQKWSSILTLYYGVYAGMIYRPVLLKADFVLTIRDLLQLNMAVPVYLRQTGHYYIIRKLIVKGKDLAEAELIQM